MDNARVLGGANGTRYLHPPPHGVERVGQCVRNGARDSAREERPDRLRLAFDGARQSAGS